MTSEVDLLKKRIELLESYLSQFDSYRSFNLSHNKPAAKKKKKVNGTRGCRLPEDWQPDTTLITWAQTDFPAVDLPLETAKFIDYWLSRADKGAIKLSWDRTFRNWIRQASINYRKKHEAHKRNDKLDYQSAVRNAFD